MLISLDWISDFVDLTGIAPEEIAEKLTVHTAEVEGWETLERVVQHIVAGHIASVEPLASEAGSGVWATVDVGNDRTVGTVCGAPNAAAGAAVAVALPGARLANGEDVQPAEVHGRRSEAVLCSPAELGWSGAHDGLLLLPPDVAPGTELGTLVAARDVLIEIDNKSLTHRPDLWGQYGFARELAAIFRRPLRPYATTDLSQFDELPALPVTVETPEDCPYYGAVWLEVGPNRPSPLRWQSRLHAIGSRSRSLLVDVTNYVQFELGQPTHAFDGSQVESIRVARSGKTQDITTLDGRSWKILPDDLLIHDGQRPIAIAGVMGGRHTEVSETTRTVLLESANFRAARIRQTSVRLPLRTDASLRFEKKLPPVFSRLAAGRVVYLFGEAGYEHRAVSRFTTVGNVADTPRTIRLPAGYLTRRAGTDISDETATALLTSIGLGCEPSADGELIVSIPAFRGVQDMAIPEDVSEEVMRLYGYDRITPRLPELPTVPVPADVRTRNHHRHRRILAQGHGYVEVQTYGWFAEDWIAAIGYRPARATLDLRNPVASDRHRMRDTLLPNLLAVAQQNRKISDRFRIFELGRVFWLDETGTKQEANELTGLTVNQTGGSNAEADFRAVRGAIDDLAKAAGLPPLTFRRGDTNGPPWTGSRATLEILRDGQVVGGMGLLPALLRRKVIDAGQAVWFTLRIDELAGELYPTTRYQAPAVFPGSDQDFTFVWPVDAGYQDLQATLAGFAHPTLERLAFQDVYVPKNQPTANYTVRFHIGRPDRTIAGDDIQSFRDALLAFAQSQGLKLV